MQDTTEMWGRVLLGIFFRCQDLDGVAHLPEAGVVELRDVHHSAGVFPFSSRLGGLRELTCQTGRGSHLRQDP